MTRGFVIILIAIVVAAIISAVSGHLASDSLAMAVGALFGMLASFPTALLVGINASKLPRETQHHTHDVTVRIVPPTVQRAMAQYGADDAVKINGQWLLLDGDRVVSSQRLLAA